VIAAQTLRSGRVPVVDGCGKLVGIVDRRRILDAPLPRAA
jgi:CBS domain-containing protein